MSCGVRHRCSSDPALLWLWCRPAATAPIRPLAWEPPYAAAAAQEMEKKTNIVRHCRQLESINSYQGTLIQNRNGLADIENSLVVALGVGMDRELRVSRCKGLHTEG